jgi:hypothetical protein
MPPTTVVPPTTIRELCPIPILNVDTNGDGIADRNLDTDGNGIADTLVIFADEIELCRPPVVETVPPTAVQVTP